MILQILIILLTARALAFLLRRVGQPPVIGEMAAGFVLGPILFGSLLPEWQLQIFAPDSLREVNALGQLGLIFFMFLIGVELRISKHDMAQRFPHGAAPVIARDTRRPWRDSLRLAALSVLLPMMTGLALAPFLHPAMAPPGVTFWPFALFIGTALSVTALPVLARILKERKLVDSAPGQLALSAAALGDVIAWLMLAAVLSISVATSGQLGHGSSDGTGAGIGMAGLGNVALLLPFGAFIFGVLRPWLARMFCATTAAVPLGSIALLLMGALLSSWLTEYLQVHAAFGAFIFGLCLPRNDHLLAELRRRVEPLVLMVLMPCFFAYAGLSTSGDAFAATGTAVMLLILGAAVVGKIIAGTLGARLARLSWRESLMVGAMMNTRGVVELVFLKVGLDAGLISKELYTVLFATALITTLMTTPLLSYLLRGKKSLV